MRFPTAIATALLGASTILAVHTSSPKNKRDILCENILEAEPQCCTINVLNVADIQCTARTSSLYCFTWSSAKLTTSWVISQRDC